MTDQGNRRSRLLSAEGHGTVQLTEARISDRRRREVASWHAPALGLRDLFQEHIDGLWIPEHLMPQEAAEFALDHFKRAVVGGLEVLDVEGK